MDDKYLNWKTAVIVPYGILCAILYQYGYWRAYGVDPTQFMQIEELIIRSIVPIVGLIMFSLIMSSGISVKGKWHSLILFIMMSIAFLFAIYSTYEIFTIWGERFMSRDYFLVLLFSFVLSVVVYFEKFYGRFGFRGAFVVILVIFAPLNSYQYGLFQSAKKNNPGCFYILETGEIELSGIFLGKLGDFIFVEHMSGEIEIIRIERISKFRFVQKQLFQLQLRISQLEMDIDGTPSGGDSLIVPKPGGSPNEPTKDDLE